MFSKSNLTTDVGIYLAVTSMSLGIAYLIVCALLYRHVAPKARNQGHELTFEEVTSSATSSRFAILADEKARSLLLPARFLYFTSYLCVALGAILIFVGQTLG